jgi:polyphosphate kinase
MDHRIEATCPVLDAGIRNELKEILQIQLSDNVKARWLDNNLQNNYKKDQSKKVRSQIEIYQYLNQKIIKVPLMQDAAPIAQADQMIPI